MIALPRRSVTRFFVPLIDVLILLFCIFLLMPFVSKTEPVLPARDPDETNSTASTAVAELQRQLREAQRRIDRLMKERSNLSDRMSVKVLEIDGETGKLFNFDSDGRQEVRDQSDAQRIIDRQRRVAGTKEPFILILYPRVLTGYPLQRQIETYSRWFRDVPHGFDNPWSYGAP